MIRCFLYLSRRGDRITSMIDDESLSEYGIYIERRHYLSLWDHTLNFFKINREFKKRKYDVIVSDGVGMMAFHLFLLARLHSVKIVMRLRGDCWTEYDDSIRKARSSRDPKLVFTERLDWFVTRIALHEVDLFIPVSKYLSDVISERAPNKESLVIYNSKDRMIREFRDDTNIDDRKDILLITNCNFQRKIDAIFDHLDQLIEIMTRHPNYTLKILCIGDGFQEFKERFEHTVGGRILNFQFKYNESDMLDAYNRSVLCIYLSYLDSFGSIIQEAQCVGVPVISNRCCGLVEQIENGVTGFLIDEKDDLVRFTDMILKDEDLYRTIRRNAHKSCEDRYSHDIGNNLFHQSIMEVHG